MHETDESRRRLDLLLEVDRSFKQYELELPMDEATSAARLLGRPDIGAFIDAARSLVSEQGTTESLHSMRLGRSHDSQLVILELFKDFVSDIDLTAASIEMRALANGAKHCQREESETTVEVRARWPR